MREHGASRGVEDERSAQLCINLMREFGFIPDHIVEMCETVLEHSKRRFAW